MFWFCGYTKPPRELRLDFSFSFIFNSSFNFVFLLDFIYPLGKDGEKVRGLPRTMWNWGWFVDFRLDVVGWLFPENWVWVFSLFYDTYLWIWTIRELYEQLVWFGRDNSRKNVCKLFNVEMFFQFPIHTFSFFFELLIHKCVNYSYSYSQIRIHHSLNDSLKLFFNVLLYSFI